MSRILSNIARSDSTNSSSFSRIWSDFPKFFLPRTSFFFNFLEIHSSIFCPFWIPFFHMFPYVFHMFPSFPPIFPPVSFPGPFYPGTSLRLLAPGPWSRSGALLAGRSLATDAGAMRIDVEVVASWNGGSPKSSILDWDFNTWCLIHVWISWEDLRSRWAEMWLGFFPFS